MAEETCILDPERQCLGLIKARELEQDLNDLRKQNSSSHERIFDRLGEMEKQESIRRVQYEYIAERLGDLNAKLDGLVARISEVESKPAKRWESLVGYVLGAIAGAFIMWAAAGTPGL